jgi:hypothetical protein
MDNEKITSQIFDRHRSSSTRYSIRRVEKALESREDFWDHSSGRTNSFPHEKSPDPSDRCRAIGLRAATP